VYDADATGSDADCPTAASAQAHHLMYVSFVLPPFSCGSSPAAAA